jgi:predicted O-methyltransferase YrrM
MDTTSINNVTTLPWETIKTSMPQIDFAQVVVNYFADNDIFDAVVNAIKPGGLLIVSNSSNGGELYQESGETGFAHQVHARLKDTQKFDIMHMQGYISYTLCVRKVD